MELIKRIKIGDITLRRIYKFLKNKFLNFYYSFLWIYTSNGKKSRKNISKFKNIHLGQDVVLIANGPGLNKINTKYFKNKILFGMNRIYLSDNINVNYLCCINDLVTNQFSDDFNNLNIDCFFKFRSFDLFNNSEKKYFFEKGYSSVFSKDLSNGLNAAATVTYACLQIIYYMGFKRVFIVGLDHNFDYKGNVNETQKVKDDTNHFIKNYFPKGSKWETPDLFSSEYFYNIALNKFKNDDREIYDCSIDGKCKVFPKKSLSDFIK